MKYWKKIFSDEKNNTYKSKMKQKKECAETGYYLIDDSHFIPMSELVKRNAQTGPLRLGNDIVETYYDFPDGKDTGIDVSNRNSKNIAELSKTVREQQSKLSKEITKAKEKAKTHEEVNKIINSNN